MGGTTSGAGNTIAPVADIAPPGWKLFFVCFSRINSFAVVAHAVGTNVTVRLGGITINFGRVTAPGTTIVTPANQCIPTAYVVNNLTFDITTTATVSGPITVSFDLSRLLPQDPTTPAIVSALRVFHGENGVLVDRTAPPNPLVPPSLIKVANVNSLSPFTIAVQPPQAALQSTLDELRALRQTVTNEGNARRLDDTLHDLTRALDPSLWLDPAHLQPNGGERLFNETKDAVSALSELLGDEHGDEQRDDLSTSEARGANDDSSSLPAATVRFYVERITRVDGRLARIAVNDAKAAGRDQETITRATNQLNQGDAHVAEGKRAQAIADYAQAWRLAVSAQLKAEASLFPAVAGCSVGYNPCPGTQPFQHCNVFGSCYCSAYP